MVFISAKITITPASSFHRLVCRGIIAQKRKAIVFAHGKQQLADYLTTEVLAEGFYVVFSQKHKANDTLFFDETIAGKRIRTDIIRTDFTSPSTRPLANGKPKRPTTRRKAAGKSS